MKFFLWTVKQLLIWLHIIPAHNHNHEHSIIHRNRHYIFAGIDKNKKDFRWIPIDTPYYRLTIPTLGVIPTGAQYICAFCGAALTTRFIDVRTGTNEHGEMVITKCPSCNAPIQILVYSTSDHKAKES